MGFADNFENLAKATNGGATYFTGDGSYGLKIKSYQVKEVPVKNSSKKKEAVIVELEVTRSTNPNHPVGAVRSFFRYTDDDKALGEIKNIFFAACLGVEPTAVRPYAENPGPHDQCAKLIQAAEFDNKALEFGLPVGFIVGRPLDVECKQTTTKAGAPFTKMAFHPAQALPPTT